jgi:hypothetical protein
VSFSFGSFQLHDMLRCGRELRQAAQEAGSIEEAAEWVARYLYDAFVDPEGRRECVLVRFYKTHPFASLPEDLRAFAIRLLADEPVRPDMRCLVLLGSAGEKPAWNSRRGSVGHQAIPLPSAQIVERAPMIAQMIRGLGLEIEAVVTPSPDFVRTSVGKTYNVFYVEEALGSPYIPAQEEFVQPYGVRSVVGFGGLLLSGDLYCAILFARVPIASETAQRFRNIALDLKLAISALERGRTFRDPVAVVPEA